MATFRGIIEVEGEPDSAVVSDVEVRSGIITLRAGGQSIGSWDLNDITITPSADYYRIEADDEVLRLRIRDAKRFSATVGTGLPERDPAAGDRTGSADPATAPRTTAPGAAAPQAPSETKPRPPGPDQSKVSRPVSFALGAAAVGLFIGSFLSWGPWRLAGGRFPVGRLIGALAGVAMAASAYLALAGEKRRDVGLVASLGAVIALTIVLLYVLDSPIGLGLVLMIMATTAAVTVSVMTFLPLAARPESDEEQPHLRV